MSKVRVTYDCEQHCTSLKESHAKAVAMDCPYTGKGEEFSPGELAGTSLAGCMFLSLGAVAQRNNLERAAGLCPIKLSFHPDIPISVQFNYPE